jgi:hypothetical protein
VGGGVLVARDVCRGLPCPIVVHEPDGTKRVLAPDAGLAVLGGADGGIVVVEGAGGRLRSIDVQTGSATSLDTSGVLPVGGGSLATSGASSAPGEILLAPGGRVAGLADLRRVHPAGEVVP